MRKTYWLLELMLRTFIVLCFALILMVKKGNCMAIYCCTFRFLHSLVAGGAAVEAADVAVRAVANLQILGPEVVDFASGAEGIQDRKIEDLLTG